MLIWQKYLKVLGQVSSTLPSSTSKYQVLSNFKVWSTSKYQVLEFLHQVPSTSTLLDPNPDEDSFTKTGITEQMDGGMDKLMKARRKERRMCTVTSEWPVAQKFWQFSSTTMNHSHCACLHEPTWVALCHMARLVRTHLSCLLVMIYQHV